MSNINHNGIPDKPRRVAILVRVSTEEQRERETIETQRQRCEDYCRAVGWEVVETYPDEGVSGTVPLRERPAGARLLRDAEAGLFDTVLVYKLDRLGRDPRHTLNVIHELVELGLVVKSVTENLDVETPAGRFMLTMLAGAAGLERENTLERSRDAMNRLARDGAWLGGIVPYGYRIEGTGRAARLVPSETKLPGTDLSEADVIRLVFRLAAEEHRSCIYIANSLTALGVPPSYVKDGRQVKDRSADGSTSEDPAARNKRTKATAGIWRPSRVRSLIVNPTYKGMHVYGKRAKKARETITRGVPPLVGDAAWSRAQDVLRENRILSPHNARRQYLLRGLIRCGLCGLTYIGTAYPDYPAGVKTYYVCNGKHSARGIYGLKGERCPSKAIRASEIEGMIWADIEGFLNNPGETVGYLVAQQRAARQSAEQVLANVAAKEGELAAKAEERALILGLYRRRRIVEADLDRQLDAIDGEERAIKRDLAGLRRQLRSAEEEAHQAEAAADLLRRLRQKLALPLTWETRRQVVEALVASVRIETSVVNGRKEAKARVVYRFTEANDCTGRGSARRPASSSPGRSPCPGRG